MTWSQVLVNSSNIGMIQGAHRLSYQQLHDAVARFGFGRPMGIGLPGEGAGVVTPMKSWSKSTQTSVAFGNEVAVTPIQMCRAFSAFARPGDLAGTLPRLRLTAARFGRATKRPVCQHRWTKGGIQWRHESRGDQFQAVIVTHKEGGL